MSVMGSSTEVSTLKHNEPRPMVRKAFFQAAFSFYNFASDCVRTFPSSF